jgi:hypothetical protein
LQLFEISDVVLLDDQNEVGARNERRLVALHSNLTSGFEVSAAPLGSPPQRMITFFSAQMAFLLSLRPACLHILIQYSAFSDYFRRLRERVLAKGWF